MFSFWAGTYTEKKKQREEKQKEITYNIGYTYCILRRLEPKGKKKNRLSITGTSTMQNNIATMAKFEPSTCLLRYVLSITRTTAARQMLIRLFCIYYTLE